MVTSHLAAAPPDAVVIAASRGDAELFGVIYDRYAASLYRYAYQRLGPEHTEDVVAKTFLAAFRHRGRYDLARQDARPWLFGILTKEIARRRWAEQARYRALSRAGVDDVMDGAAVLTAAVLVLQVVPFGDRPPAARAQAADILRAAAAQAAQQSDLTVRPEQFVLVETIATVRTTREATKHARRRCAVLDRGAVRRDCRLFPR